MLSRTAEAFFWIGRYTERAEYAARTALVHHNILLEHAETAIQAEVWGRVLAMDGALELFRERHGEVATKPVLEFLALDPENPDSLLSAISAGRVNARTIQDQLSSEAWHHLNRSYLLVKELGRKDVWERTQEVLIAVRDAGYTLQGLLSNTMLHDERLAFCWLGRDVERAGRTLRLLKTLSELEVAQAPAGLPEFQRCVGVLKSASAYEAYRKTYRAGVEPAKIVDFLLLSERFPRAVRFCARSMARLMPLIAPPGRSEPERLVGQLDAEMAYASLPEIFESGLESYLDSLAARLGGISDAFSRHYFRYADAPPSQFPRLPQRRKAFPRPDAPTSVVQAVLRVRQDFSYTYDGPVTDVRTVLRLIPNQRFGRQRLLDVAFRMEPRGEVRQHVDAFGNQVWEIDHAQIARTLSCEVEMLVENHAVYHAEGVLALRGVAPSDEEGVAGPAEYLTFTPLTEPSEPMIALSARLKAEHAASAALAEAIMREVGARLRYQPGVTTVTTTAAQAFALGAGVCQDVSHVMIALCRAVGVPARYVSGYLPTEGAMHAWVEVLVADPASGKELWVAYDPTHARRADETYVTVAIGRDYQDVTPTSGFYTGKAGNVLSVRVQAKPEARKPIAKTAGTAPLALPGIELRIGQEAQQQQ